MQSGRAGRLRNPDTTGKQRSAAGAMRLLMNSGSRATCFPLWITAQRPRCAPPTPTLLPQSTCCMYLRPNPLMSGYTLLSFLDRANRLLMIRQVATGIPLPARQSGRTASD